MAPDAAAVWAGEPSVDFAVPRVAVILILADLGRIRRSAIVGDATNETRL
jgi:hypothetical protein